MLFDELKKNRIQAMKDKDDLKKGLLATLQGDLEKNCKVVDGKKTTPSDVEFIQMVRKYVTNINEKVLPYLQDGSEAWNKAVTERTILELYLPKQLTEEGLEAAIKHAIAFGANNIGGIMKYLKDNHEGRYDGKLASQLIQKVLKGE